MRPFTWVGLRAANLRAGVAARARFAVTAGASTLDQVGGSSGGDFWAAARQGQRSEPTQSRAAPPIRELTEAERQSLRERGLATLEQVLVKTSDGRTYTLANPHLYPHRWGWDTADVARAFVFDPMLGLEQVVGQLRDQWEDGRVPQITYNPDVPRDAYFPGPDVWQRTAPSGAETTGFIQPPTQARAMAELLEAAEKKGGTVASDARGLVQQELHRLVKWHRYLLTNRDPERSGIPTTISSWESGMDNLVSSEEPNRRITVPANLETYQRKDLKPGNEHMRPPHWFYDAQVTSIRAYQGIDCDDSRLEEIDFPYRVKDPHMGGILLDANHALLDLHERLVEAGAQGLSQQDLADVNEWIARGRAGMEKYWDAELGGPVPVDLRIPNGELRNRTIGVFGPLMSGDLTVEQYEAQRALLFSEHFINHPQNVLGLPPSTAITDKGFDANRYWLGPTWPVEIVRIIDGLERFSMRPGVSRSVRMRAATDADLLASRLAQALCQTGRDEYFNVLTGEGLGAEGQSWTAWLRLRLADRPVDYARGRVARSDP